MKLKVSDYIAEFIRVQQIHCVYEVAGGMITHLLDSIYQYGSTNIISMHHEQSAAFAADVYGRITGKPGFAFATSGPGATNLLTGIANAYFDSSPAVFITGQVNIQEQKGGRLIRQLGFQETDIVTMAHPITKKSFRVDCASEVPAILCDAYQCAIQGRPGSVLIDIPMNIQREKISISPIEVLTKSRSKEQISESTEQLIRELLVAIQQSNRPLILAGRGVRSSFSQQALQLLVEKSGIPVVTSLLGLDVLPYAHPKRVGFIGTYGNRWANLVLGAADLLIVLGSRLDVRQTGADTNSFSMNKKIFHVDCDEGEINNRVTGCVPIVSDLKDFLDVLNQRIVSVSINDKKLNEWQEEIDILKRKWPDIDEQKGSEGINPNYFMHVLSQNNDDAFAYLADVGNHQMWAAQSLELNDHQIFITSGGMGAMGFALPAGIGASLVLNKKPVVVIVGDGGMQFNLQELQTIIRNKLPVRIIVINNNCLGMIRQFQDSYFDGRYQSTYWGYSAPDFSKIADAYGIPSMTISDSESIQLAMKWMREHAEEPILLQVMVRPETNVYPKIAYGRPLTEMEPFAKPISMEST